MDGIKALCGNIIRPELSNILKKHFLDKPNRHLVLTSYFPIYLDETNRTPVNFWSNSDISNHSIVLLDMPESARELKQMSPPDTDGITSGFAIFYGGVPSFIYIYTAVTQQGDYPAVRFSRLIVETSYDVNEYASFVEALITGQPHPCLGKYMYAQCILRHFRNDDARELAEAMFKLEDISDVNGDSKLWEQMTKVAILQHLNVAKYRMGYGPFGNIWT